MSTTVASTMTEHDSFNDNGLNGVSRQRENGGKLCEWTGWDQDMTEIWQLKLPYSKTILARTSLNITIWCQFSSKHHRFYGFKDFLMETVFKMVAIIIKLSSPPIRRWFFDNHCWPCIVKSNNFSSVNIDFSSNHCWTHHSKTIIWKPSSYTFNIITKLSPSCVQQPFWATIIVGAS